MSSVSHCRVSGWMAIFLGVSAAPKRILLSEFSYASVQHSLSQPESFIVFSEAACSGDDVPAEGQHPDGVRHLLLILRAADSL